MESQALAERPDACGRSSGRTDGRSRSVWSSGLGTTGASLATPLVTKSMLDGLAGLGADRPSRRRS